VKRIAKFRGLSRKDVWPIYDKKIGLTEGFGFIKIPSRQAVRSKSILVHYKQTFSVKQSNIEARSNAKITSGRNFERLRPSHKPEIYISEANKE
jgi:hypothetical protein